MKLSPARTACVHRLHRASLSHPTSSSTPFATTQPTLSPLRRGYASAQTSSASDRYVVGSAASQISETQFKTFYQRPGPSVFVRVSEDRHYECFKQFGASMRENDARIALVAKALERHGFTDEVVYEMGCMLYGHNRIHNSALDAWRTASAMGSKRATLSLIKQLIWTNTYGKSKALSAVESKFQQIVSTDQDPNAAYLQGELLLNKENYHGAVMMLEKALKSVKPFEWRGACELCLGRVYARLDRREDAIRLLGSKNIEEAGLAPSAYAELGLLYRTTNLDKAEDLMQQAVLGGVRNIFTHLGELCMNRSSRATDKAKEREYLLKALEWLRLSDPKAED